MNENEWLAERFEEHRGHLRAVAYRMLGSLPQAEIASLVGCTTEAASQPGTTPGAGG